MIKNRYHLEDRDYIDGVDIDMRKQKDKRQEKRFERALKIRDVSALIEDEEDETGFENYYSIFQEEDL